MKTAVFFGSTTGNTEAAAEAIAEKIGADIFNVADAPREKISDYQMLIFGTSTWGIGDLQDDWEGFIADLEEAGLEGKEVALFGLGDADSYPESFVDGMGTIYRVIKDKGCSLVGFTDTADYSYESSSAEVDGRFVGLVLDEDNESDKTQERIENWVEDIKKAMQI